MSPDHPTRDDALREQLSAWMDGELPADEARFLERRLSHDPVLAALARYLARVAAERDHAVSKEDAASRARP